MAADKRCTIGGLVVAVSKIVHHNGCLIASTGDGSIGRECIAWYMAGAKVESWPINNRDPDKGASLLVVRPDRTLWRYDNGPHPYRVESVPVAFGAGGEAALAAMLAGADAHRAVEIASLVNAYCGNGVDVATPSDTARQWGVLISRYLDAQVPSWLEFWNLLDVEDSSGALRVKLQVRRSCQPLTAYDIYLTKNDPGEPNEEKARVFADELVTQATNALPQELAA